MTPIGKLSRLWPFIVSVAWGGSGGPRSGGNILELAARFFVFPFPFAFVAKYCADRGEIVTLTK